MSDMPDEIWAEREPAITHAADGFYYTRPVPSGLDLTRYIRASRNPWPKVCVQQEEEIARLRKALQDAHEIARRQCRMIEEAPHADSCAAFITEDNERIRLDYMECDCWKSRIDK